MMKVFLSVYACEPDKGSEPGVGWHVATGMAARCQVLAITRANNRPAIEAALANRAGPHPEFLYYDLPPLLLRLKKRVLGTSAYYILWQIAARWHFRHEIQKADLIHHVTFNGVQFPGFWMATGKPVLLGPLGGGMTCPPAMLPLFGKAARKESIRTWIVRHLHFLPWWNPILAAADTVLAANRETADLLEKHRHGTVPVMLETAVDPASISKQQRLPRPADALLRVLWLGQWEPRKAAVLALHALAIALEAAPDIRLIFAGSGPEESRMRTEAARLGISEQVDFLGRVPKAEVNALMDNSDAFLFTSIRDTSGNVVLEAMSRALPVIAVWHQGVREICDPASALLVEPTTPEETARGLAACLVRLRQEEGLGERIGAAGRERITEHFTWPIYLDRMATLYQRILATAARS